MNDFAPQHSRIFKEVCQIPNDQITRLNAVQMILIAKPSKPFTFTTKKTARRGAILREYEAEINALYDAFEESTQSDIASPSTWAAEDIFAYVRTVVTRVLKKDISDSGDIFEHGCDRYVPLVLF